MADAPAIAAKGGKASRGAHACDDFQYRDDENGLWHSFYMPSEKSVTKRAVNVEPKTVDTFQPTIRVYSGVTDYVEGQCISLQS